VPAALARYTQCLTSHGVPASIADARFGRFRGGNGSGGATTGTGATGSSTPGSGSTAGGSTPGRTRPTIPAQYRTAYSDCRSLLPTGGFGRNLLNNPQFAAYRNCLQLHGVTLPTSRSGTGTPGTTGGSTPGTGFANNPTARAARQACASLLPAGSGFAGSTTSVAS
jgi:hypothetical protein